MNSGPSNLLKLIALHARALKFKISFDHWSLWSVMISHMSPWKKYFLSSASSSFFPFLFFFFPAPQEDFSIDWENYGICHAVRVANTLIRWCIFKLNHLTLAQFHLLTSLKTYCSNSTPGAFQIREFCFICSLTAEQLLLMIITEVIRKPLKHIKHVK